MSGEGAIPAGAITLGAAETFTIWRTGKVVGVSLAEPHDVLSTSSVNGGSRSGLRHLVNEQMCEGTGDDRAHAKLTELGVSGYHDAVCASLGLDPAEVALMGTAAQMQYVAIERSSFREITVTAVVTAGVATNAATAGDPGPWYEEPEDFSNVAGTINTILVSNIGLSSGALARSVGLLTEAKTAALNELAVPSKSSDRLATGTGTDQFCVAAPAHGARRLQWAGHHTKLGELIGVSVRNATLEAVRWQNGLEPSLTRNLFHALGRHGFTDPQLTDAVVGLLDDAGGRLFAANVESIVNDPQVAASAYAVATLLDRRRAGTLSADSADEAILNQCALLAVAVSNRPDVFAVARAELESALRDVARQVPAAIAIGWRLKWT
ncbi:MAG TPA: adenosylcobinamide amidohydrolase [Acidimicrobiia bacterium]|jgi:adenosylcobinamide amidohydrolase